MFPNDRYSRITSFFTSPKKIIPISFVFCNSEYSSNQSLMRKFNSKTYWFTDNNDDKRKIYTFSILHMHIIIYTNVLELILQISMWTMNQCICFESKKNFYVFIFHILILITFKSYQKISNTINLRMTGTNIFFFILYRKKGNNLYSFLCRINTKIQ